MVLKALPAKIPQIKQYQVRLPSLKLRLNVIFPPHLVCDHFGALPPPGYHRAWLSPLLHAPWTIPLGLLSKFGPQTAAITDGACSRPPESGPDTSLVLRAQRLVRGHRRLRQCCRLRGALGYNCSAQAVQRNGISPPLVQVYASHEEHIKVIKECIVPILAQGGRYACQTELVS